MTHTTLNICSTHNLVSKTRWGHDNSTIINFNY